MARSDYYSCSLEMKTWHVPAIHANQPGNFLHAFSSFIISKGQKHTVMWEISRTYCGSDPMSNLSFSYHHHFHNQPIIISKMNSYPLGTSIKMWIHAITTGGWSEAKMVQDHICRHKLRTTTILTQLFVALLNLSAHVLCGQSIVIQPPKIRWIKKSTGGKFIPSTIHHSYADTNYTSNCNTP
jgi:hypothetical protein